jgi:hypothetical protein
MAAGGSRSHEIIAKIEAASRGGGRQSAVIAKWR